jgi:hypothetical protein
LIFANGCNIYGIQMISTTNGKVFNKFNLNWKFIFLALLIYGEKSLSLYKELTNKLEVVVLSDWITSALAYDTQEVRGNAQKYII